MLTICQILRRSVEVIKTLPPAQQAGAIHSYVVALRYAMTTLGVASCILTSASALMIRNLDLRTHKPGGKGDVESVAGSTARNSEEQIAPEKA